MKPNLFLWTTNGWTNLPTEKLYDYIIEDDLDYKEVLGLVKHRVTGEHHSLTMSVGKDLERWATKKGMDSTRVNWEELAGHFIQTYFERM
jgi:hypothetical protein